MTGRMTDERQIVRAGEMASNYSETALNALVEEAIILLRERDEALKEIRRLKEGIEKDRIRAEVWREAAKVADDNYSELVDVFSETAEALERSSSPKNPSE